MESLVFQENASLGYFVVRQWLRSALACSGVPSQPQPRGKLGVRQGSCIFFEYLCCTADLPMNAFMVLERVLLFRGVTVPREPNPCDFFCG